jgi:hypothetical protein
MKLILSLFAANLTFSSALADFKLSSEMIKELDQYFSEEHLEQHMNSKDESRSSCVNVIVEHQKAVHGKDEAFRRSINQLATLEEKNEVERAGCLSAQAHEKLLYNLYWEASLDILIPYLRAKITEQKTIEKDRGESVDVEDVTDSKDHSFVQMPSQKKGKWVMEKETLSKFSKYEIFRRLSAYYLKTSMPPASSEEENNPAAMAVIEVMVPKPVNGMWVMSRTKFSDISRWDLYNNFSTYYGSLVRRNKQKI